MSKLVWDKTGERLYETGVKQGVLYPLQTGGLYTKGVAWNGLTAVTESPSGAEASPIYADDIKYLNLMSAEEFGATIEAYTYPDEFAVCDGSVEIQTGVTIGQQSRKMFGLSYRTALGNDVEGADFGYKLHLIYGAMAAPSEKAYATVNDSPEAITFSWEVTTTPVSVTGFKPTASLVIDSTKVDADKLSTLEDILYGSDGVEPRLPLPDEIASIFAGAVPGDLTVTSAPLDESTGVSISDNIVLTFNNAISEENVIVTSSTGLIVPIAKSFDAARKILTINPSMDLSPATMYLVNLVGVTDVFAQSLDPTVINFTTA